MTWSRFTYWKRGTKIVPLLTQKPKGTDKHLVYYQVKAGCFDPSPYLAMVEQEDINLKKEVEKWKKKNKDASTITFNEWYRERKSVYNKRKGQLEKAHWDHDVKRMDIFKKSLKEAFHLDLWDEVLEKEPESALDFYNEYEKTFKDRMNVLHLKLKQQSITNNHG